MESNFEFRALSVRDKKMVSGYSIENLYGGTLIYCKKESIWVACVPETVGLASSRKDRNGKTVFCGDILQKRNVDGSGAWLEVVKYTGDNWDNIHNCEKSEIVGNIHLNKNLIT